MRWSTHSSHGTNQGIYGNEGLFHIYIPKCTQIDVPQSSASYFLGDPNNDSLQRIYGVSFPSKKELDEYKVFLAEAAKRDHRKIGKASPHIYTSRTK